MTMDKSKIVNHQMNVDHLSIEWGDGHQSTFHYMWLRDNAPENRHANGQKLVDTLSIPLDLTANKVVVNGNGFNLSEMVAVIAAEFAIVAE